VFQNGWSGYPGDAFRNAGFRGPGDCSAETATILEFRVPASAAFAQAGGSVPVNLVPIGAGIDMVIAAGVCGLGQGDATASATEALARNPGARMGNWNIPKMPAELDR